MLVLTRKANEKVRIGRDIQVTVVAVQHGRVKLGFQAPGDVPVHREEVWLDIQAEEQRGKEPPCPDRI